MSELEALLALQIRATKLPAPETEYKFHPSRRWRFDFCWPDKKLAAECEGGTWGVSRHTTGKGFEADCEKYGEAVLNGWRILRFTGGMIKSGKAIRMITRALNADY